jgi:hypothetical protein
MTTRLLLKVGPSDWWSPARLGEIANRAVEGQRAGDDVVIYGEDLDHEGVREALAKTIERLGGEPTMDNPTE